MYVPILALVAYGVAGVDLTDGTTGDAVARCVGMALLLATPLLLTLEVLLHRVVLQGRFLHFLNVFGWRRPVDLERLRYASIIGTGRVRPLELRDLEGRRLTIDTLHGDLELLHRELARRFDVGTGVLDHDLDLRVDPFREHPADERRRARRRRAREAGRP